jgi:hypothetical protein
MNETLTKFRNAVSDSTDLQEKVKLGLDLGWQGYLVELGKENGYEFTIQEVDNGWKELQESDEGRLTEFELAVVSAGSGGSMGGEGAT